MLSNDKNICVLFGAGAEVSFNLCNGIEFSKAVLGINCEELNEAVRDYYTNLLNKNSELKSWYPDFHRSHFKQEDIFEASIRKKYRSENKSILISKEKTDREIQDEINRLKKNKVFCEDKYISYMGIIDEYFHTLISPKILGPYKFWGVVSCYTRAYCTLLGQMNCSKTREDYLEILNNPNECIGIMKDYSKIFSNQETYYKILCDFNNINVITTNYTTLCENIANKEESEIAYIHGKFGWFESARELLVYDVLADNMPSDDILFPYIFIQSGIKPIVEEKQLLEYGKALEFIFQSKVILVLGYNLNIDDNHINSLLKSAIRNGKKIIFFNFKNELNKSEIYYALRLSKDQEINIELVEIGEKNCYKKFKEYLKKYAEEK